MQWLHWVSFFMQWLVACLGFMDRTHGLLDQVWVLVRIFGLWWGKKKGQWIGKWDLDNRNMGEIWFDILPEIEPRSPDSLSDLYETHWPQPASSLPLVSSGSLSGASFSSRYRGSCWGYKGSKYEGPQLWRSWGSETSVLFSAFLKIKLVTSRRHVSSGCTGTNPV